MTNPAMVFPGQGSQSVGMLADLAHEPVVRAVFSTVSEAVGEDLLELMRSGSETDLSRTTVTQPLMLAADVALYRLWLEGGGAEPTVLAGHSLGEYSALVAAGAVDLDTAGRLVSQRARLMQEAVPDGRGAMAAVLGLDDRAVVAVCARVTRKGQVLEAVNFNAPAQVVVAGHGEAVREAEPLFREAGAKKVVLLPVSVPAHSSLMRPAAERYREALSAVAWRTARLPVVHNVDARVHADPADYPDLLARQLASPVFWTESVRRMSDDYGVPAVIECGPGKVLVGLVRRILPEIPVFALSEASGRDAARSRFPRDGRPS
jgi:[acyl-carrier-protein] S-malonyltransferase